LSWTACSPYWEDLEETVVSFKGEQTVENNGDIPVQIEASIPFISKNPKLYNRANNKELSLVGTFGDTVKINTNNGEKRVEAQEQAFSWVCGGTVNDCIKIGNEIFYVGTQIIKENVLSGETKTLQCGKQKELFGIAYGNGKIVVVGSSNECLISEDGGETWERQQNTGTGSLKKITYAKNKFVAVGDSGIFISTDGASWTKKMSGTMNGVIYSDEKDLFVVCGFGYGAKSTDGETWESVASLPSCYGICYGNGQFVAVGYYSSQGIQTVIEVSSDGTTWESVTNSLGVVLNSVIWHKTKYIMSGNNGVIVTTEDMETWNTQAIESLENIALRQLISYSNTIVVVGNGGTIAKSEDATEWEIETSGTTLNLTDIIYAQGKYVAIGQDKIATSTDLVHWTIQSTGTTTTLFGLCYGNGKFVVVGESRTLLTSENAITWENHSSAIGTNQVLNSVIFEDNKFVITGNYGIYVSTDTETWVHKAYTSATSVCYGEKGFVACRSNGNVLVSTDGESWVERETATSVILRGIEYGADRYVAVGDDGTIIVSEDTIEWESVGITTTTDFKDIIFHNGNFFVVGGLLWATSVDGKNWEYRTGEFPLAGLTTGKNTVVAVGNQGIVAELEVLKTENLISSLSVDSNMTFNIETGTNTLFFEDENARVITLKYRQKYIGV
jgi:photosystem II stability/assembly factor-like uncharacterized protein